jgi:hypothetical protein
MNERVRYIASGVAVGVGAALLLGWPLVGMAAPLGAVGAGLVAILLRGSFNRAPSQRLVLAANEELAARLGRALRWLAAATPVLLFLAATGHPWARDCAGLALAGSAALCSQRTYALFLAAAAALLALCCAVSTVVLSLHAVTAQSWFVGGGSSRLPSAGWSQLWKLGEGVPWTRSALFGVAAWLTAGFFLTICVAEFAAPLVRHLAGRGRRQPSLR